MSKSSIHTELVWQGKYDGQLTLPPPHQPNKVTLPFQTVESISEPREGDDKRIAIFGDQRKDDWTNKLIWGDNKLVVSSLLHELAGKVDLIYIDPPFDIGADFSIEVSVGDDKLTKKPSILEEKAYRDTWGKGTDSYLQMLYERLILMRDLLSETGSIYVHLDWHVGHYAKILLDEVFGRDNFRNEIIWYYPDYLQGNVTKGFPRKNDLIFYYSKTSNFTFNRVKEKLGKPVMRNKVFWNKETQRMDIVRDENGKIVYEEYTDKYCDTIWTIGQTPVTRPLSNEYLGYDTQKPEELLRRVIEASSNEGDLIADFFCGSGTTGAVAEKLGRRWIMADLGRFAIHTSRKRLMAVQRELKDKNASYRPFEILNLGKYERQHWQKSSNINNYLRFITDLYRGESLNGFSHLHGRKDGNPLHIGAVDAPVTMDEIEQAVEECKANSFSTLDVLGWEWEMGVNEEAIKAAKDQGVKLRLFQIPREVMEKQAVEKGEVRFFELDYMGLDVEQEDEKVKIKLTGFAIPSDDLIPEDLRSKITNWADYIDYWSVDWDYESLHSDSGKSVFENNWQSFRSKKGPVLETETPFHSYENPGTYVIAVKAIDIFGNDTSKVVEVRIK